MANKQISQLTAKPTPVASTDQFGIDDVASDSWKITVANLQTYFSTLYLLLSGGTMTGNLILNADPTTNLQAATKQYVDNIASGLNVQPSCRVASIAALTVTYNNGTAGVGATLTNAGAQAAIAIDGVTLALTNRVLIKNQASTFQNGIYTVTTLGSGASNWVLTRATDYDTAAEITPGDFVLVLSGTVNAQTQWVETATVTTVGTDPIVWDQFGADINGIITAIQNNSYVYSEDTGAANAYVATLAPALAAYTEGQLVILDVANTNTAASTINVNGLGAISISTPQGGALQAGDMLAGRRAWILITSGSTAQLVNRNIELRNQNDSFNYILDTGAADVYVATLVPALPAYVTGQRLRIKIANTNLTTTPTINVNGLGAKTIVRLASTALLAGDLPVGMIAELGYDGTNYQLLNPAMVAGRLINTQYLTASGTYTPTAGTKTIRLRGIGGGGGGGPTGTGLGTAGGSGGDTSFNTNTLIAKGGSGAPSSGLATPVGGVGGVAGTGSLTLVGSNGGSGAGNSTNATVGGTGAPGIYGQGAGQGAANAQPGGAAAANTGAGGGGGGGTGVISSGGGGGSGGYTESTLTGITGTYSYVIGAAGAAGVAGTAGQNGGAGGTGLIIVQEFS